MMRIVFITFGFGLAVTLAGCQKDASTKMGQAPPASTSERGDPEKGGHHDEGPFIELGTSTAGGWTLAVTRDAGELKPGGEAAIDCTVTGGTGTVTAVRFWIGTEDAQGALKALAAIEDPAEPQRWHTHAEIPNPLGEESKLWVEVEDGEGVKQVAGLSLKL